MKNLKECGFCRDKSTWQNQKVVALFRIQIKVEAGFSKFQKEFYFSLVTELKPIQLSKSELRCRTNTIEAKKLTGIPKAHDLEAAITALE